MESKKDKLSSLQNYPEQMQPPQGLDQPAVQLAEELYGQNGTKCRARGRRKRWLVALPALAVALALIVSLSIILPLNMAPADPDAGRHYLGEELYHTILERDVGEFLEENGKSGRYFDSDYFSSSVFAYCLKEDDRLMYILQDALFLTDNGFDTIVLGVVFSSASFDEFEPFDELVSQIQLLGMDISYSVSESSGLYLTRAKFESEDVHYYLEITSFEQDVLAHYVELLFS